MRIIRNEGGDSDVSPLDQVSIMPGKPQWTFLDVGDSKRCLATG